MTCTTRAAVTVSNSRLGLGHCAVRRVAVQLKYRYRTVVFLLCCCCCLAKMDQQLHRLTDRHYSEVEGLLQVRIIKYTFCAWSQYNCYDYNNAPSIFRPSSSAHSRERTHSQNTNTHMHTNTNTHTRSHIHTTCTPHIHNHNNKLAHTYTHMRFSPQAMDMPSSDHEEIESESCRLSRYNVANLYEGRQRCYTMPHVPPAPPSTPTLLTSNSNGTGISTSNGNCSAIPSVATLGASSSIGAIGSIVVGANMNANGSSSSPTASLVADNNQINHFIYVKNGKNLRRDSRCVDSELSKLFNVVSITNRLTAIKNRAHNKQPPQQQMTERGIINASRTISKLHAGGATKIFKIHRDPKEFLRETDEDSVSAPEYDEEEEDTRFRFFRRTRHSRRRAYTRMGRKFARFEHHERMETIVDSFDAAMSFNDADT